MTLDFIKNCRTNAIKYCGLFILAIATLLFYNLFSQFEEIGPNLLTNGNFQAGSSQWVYSGDFGDVVYFERNGGASLSSHTASEVISLKQDVSGPFSSRFVRLSGVFKVDRGSENTKDSARARVILLQINNDKSARYDKPHVLFSHRINTDWQPANHVFAVESGSEKIRVALQLLYFQGTLSAKSLDLRYVKINTGYEQVRTLLIALWSIAVGFWMIPLLCYGRLGLRRYVIVAWSVAIMLGVLMPESQKLAIGSLLQTSLNPAIDAIDRLDEQKFDFALKTPKIDIFKQGHFWMFAILTCMIQKNKYPCWNEVPRLVTFAFITEVLQLFVQGRTPSLSDVFIDLSGITLGSLVYYLLSPKPVKS